MLTLGKKWCNPTAVYNFGTSSQVWYYDGARVFYQIADYTRDSSFEACALNVARQYRDYVISKNGSIPEYYVFTRGLQIAYERTGDPTYRNAIVLLTKTGFVRWQQAISDYVIREVAFALNTVIDAERAGEPRSPHLARLADYLIGHYDRLFVSKNYRIHQTFFDGLAAEALIGYYDLTKDPRIPPTIKLMLDWVWDYGWNKSTYQMVYNPDPLGPTCDNSCQWYLTDLINLVAPAYAWYWNVTGDTVYQQRGDELFAHALDTDISWNGKIFSQNYHWSFDYVRWRRVEASTAISSLVLSPASTLGGSTTTANQVTLSKPAPAGGLTVSVTTSNRAVASPPTTVLVPAGATSAKFAINTFAVGTATSATITAAAGGQSKAAVLTVNTVATALVGLTLDPATLNGGLTSNRNLVSITAPAGANGAAVQLRSSNSTAASVPSQVLIPAGQTQAYVTISSHAVTASTPVTITGSFGGQSKSATLTVTPVTVTPVRLMTIRIGVTVPAGGTSWANNQVVLDAPAPAGGVAVKLTTSAPTVAIVPPSVTIAAGATSASFPIATSAVNVTTEAAISASYGGVIRTGIIKIRPVLLAGFLLSQTTVQGGYAVNWSRVSLDGPAPPGGTAVKLTSSSAAVRVPATVTVPQGQRTAYFTATTTSVTTSITATITASSGGMSLTQKLSVTP
jgi:hypothetical protein